MAGKSKAGATDRLSARQVDDILRRAAQPPARVTAIVGPEAGLSRMIVSSLLNAIRGVDPEVAVDRVSASSQLAATAIEDAAAPTLFGGSRAVVIDDLDTATDDADRALRAVMELPDGECEAWLLLVHAGAPKGRGLITAAVKSGATEFGCQRLRREAYPQVVSAHANRNGGSVSGAAAEALVDILGEDLQALLSGVEQLVADSPTGIVGVDDVHRALFGHGEVNQFTLADRVFSKRKADALVMLHRLIDLHGEQSAAIMAASALSFGLRGLAKLSGQGSRLRGPAWEVARETGVPAWKVTAIAEQLPHWPRRADLAAAAVRLARLDADLKGGMGGVGALDAPQKVLAVQELIRDLATPA